MKATKRKSSRSHGQAVSPQYKVIELSLVDETSLESALNQWSGQGWRLDGIHFAMRDSSRRPAMAFVLFTRPAPVREKESAEGSDRRRLSAGETVSTDPWRRLRELAGVQGDEDEP